MFIFLTFFDVGCLFPVNLPLFLIWSFHIIYHCYFIFSSLDILGCRVGGAARPVAAANQDLFPSHAMRRGSAYVWRAWLATSVTAVAVVTMVSMPMAAQVVKRRMWHVSLAADWLVLLTQIGCDLFSCQHAPVTTLEGTVTPTVVSASAPPTQKETPAMCVRQATGVTTPRQAARYTKIYLNTHIH